jgi:hypothetical protein
MAEAGSQAGGVSWPEIAAGFGCPLKVTEQAITAERAGLLEYVPAGQSATAFTQVYSAAVFHIPASEQEARDALVRVIARFPERVQNGAQFRAGDMLDGPQGPHAWFEYAVGPETYLAVVHRAAAGFGVIQHFITRGRAPTDAERHRLGALIGLGKGAPRRGFPEIAARFGCTKQIGEAPLTAERPGQLEYIPVTELPDRWTRLFTITVFAIPQDDAGADRAVDRLIANWRAQLTRDASLRAGDRFDGNHGPLAFFDFVIGPERTIAVVLRASAGIAAIMQLATRGREPSAQERSTLRAIIGLKD